MPFKTTINFTSPIFNKNTRSRVIGEVPIQTARELEKNLRAKNKTATRTGTLNKRRRTRRSARGERFAEDSGETLSSLKSTRTGTFSAKVEFESKTAQKLIAKGRILISENDQQESEKDFVKRANVAVKSLL